MKYIFNLLTSISFYTLLSQSLNLSVGYTGLISLAHAGFYGIGAYSAAILSTQYGYSFLAILPLAMLITGFMALVVSLIALRTVDDYFIVCTLGVQFIIYSLMLNISGLTGGPIGINDIPLLEINGFMIESDTPLFLLVAMFLMIFVWFLNRNISMSGYGKTLIAISEDEIYSQSIGKNIYMVKALSFTLSAMFASVAGVLYAYWVRYIDPESFTLSESIFILSIVIIGGLRNLSGSLYAAALLVLLPEVLKFIGVSDDVAANFREVVYGLALVLIMITGKNGMLLFVRSLLVNPFQRG